MSSSSPSSPLPGSGSAPHGGGRRRHHHHHHRSSRPARAPQPNNAVSSSAHRASGSSRRAAPVAYKASSGSSSHRGVRVKSMKGGAGPFAAAKIPSNLGVELPSVKLAREAEAAAAVRPDGRPQRGYMRRWNFGRALYDDTYIEFNQIYNFVECIYTCVRMPDGPLGGGVNLLSLGASGWLLYRKFLRAWLYTLKGTKMKGTSILWFAYTLFGVLVAAIRGNKEKLVRRNLGLL